MFDLVCVYCIPVVFREGNYAGVVGPSFDCDMLDEELPLSFFSLVDDTVCELCGQVDSKNQLEVDNLAVCKSSNGAKIKKNRVPKT